VRSHQLIYSSAFSTKPRKAADWPPTFSTKSSGTDYDLERQVFVAVAINANLPAEAIAFRLLENVN
jgi:hypothetical protein